MHTCSGGFQPFKGLFGMFSPSLTAIWHMIADILMSQRSSCWDLDTQTHTGSRKQYNCMWHSGRVSPAGWRWRRWLPNSCRVQKALWPLSTVAAEICRARKLICHTESGTLGRYDREHPPISHKLQSVSSDQCSGLPSVRLHARTKGRREQADSVINFLLICTFQKKTNSITRWTLDI